MLSPQNANVAKGQITDGQTTADILANDQLLKADYYKDLDRRLPQRRGHQTVGRRRRRGFSRKHPRGRIREWQAVRPADYLPAARRQHH